MANWFTLARDMERPDYEFGVAVEVATESIRVCHPSLNVQLMRRDEVSFECRGRSLESLVYLLFTAMDNAVAHSGFVDESPEIALETTLVDGWLEMTLTNSCVPVDDFEAANAKLTALRARLDAEDSRQNLAVTEGGTGYAKISHAIVVTGFDTFGSGTTPVTLAQLDSELAHEFSDFYLGSVYFNAATEDWRDRLRELVQNVPQLRTST